jgi:glycosyltransferase involved in cell wall biosynthesis
MRIAYFNANLRKGQDGVTRVMYKMFDGALARNIETLAFTSTLPEPADMVVPMVKVPSVPLFLQKNYRLALPSYHLFARRLNEFKPDIIHINSPCTLGFRAVKYALHFDIPVVATYHTHFPTYPRYYNLIGLEQLTWKITRHLYNQVDCTFVPSKPILEELEEHGVNNLEYLPNGVDLRSFNPRFRSNEWRKRVGAENKPVVLFVSRLVWEKDLRVLAEAYRLLRAKRDDFELVIVGDGPAREEFEQLVPGAHFLGYKSGQPLAECYASSDIFVFPSTTETFGLVTVEAMASGIVPVAAKVGGAAGIIEEGISGLFSKPFDAADMARQVGHLLDSPDLRRMLAQQALDRAQDYGWDHILEKLFTNYEYIIDEHRYKRKSRAA